MVGRSPRLLESTVPFTGTVLIDARVVSARDQLAGPLAEQLRRPICSPAHTEEIALTRALKKGPLTWGQHQHFFTRGGWLNIDVGLSPDVEAADIERALRILIRRHEVLRTTFEDPGDGSPIQVVWPPDDHDVNLSVPSLRPSRTPTLASIYALDDIRPFRQEPDRWPLRVARYITESGQARLNLQLHHVAADYLGLQNLAEDLQRILAQGQLPDPGRQPLDIAADEAAPAATDAHRRAVQYRIDHLDVLADFHQRLWREEPEAPGVELVAGGVSTAAQDGIGKFATTYGVPPGVVAVWAIAEAFADIMGTHGAQFKMTVSNRHLPGTAPSVGSLAQTGLLAPPPGRVIAADIRRAYYPAVLAATRHAHYDPTRLNREADPRLGDWSRLQGGIFNVNVVTEHRPLDLHKLDEDEIASGQRLVKKTAPRPGRGGAVRLSLYPNCTRVFCIGNAQLLSEQQIKELVSTIFGKLEV